MKLMIAFLSKTFEVLQLLQPYAANEMNAYPIDPAIKNPRANSLDLLKTHGATRLQRI